MFFKVFCVIGKICAGVAEEAFEFPLGKGLDNV